MGVISTQGIEFQLVANGEILDLFQDEDIKLSDNVTGLFDLGIIPADFTRQITLPGTKKNNAFFEHVYDISVFNPDTFATNIKNLADDLEKLTTKVNAIKTKTDYITITDNDFYITIPNNKLKLECTEFYTKAGFAGTNSYLKMNDSTFNLEHSVKT